MYINKCISDSFISFDNNNKIFRVDMFKYYLRGIGKIFGEKRPNEVHDLDPINFQSSFLLDFGVLWIHVSNNLNGQL